jgi:hypothetical protein
MSTTPGGSTHEATSESDNSQHQARDDQEGIRSRILVMPRSACLLRPVEWPTGVRRALVRRADETFSLVELVSSPGP